jgi:hypothetical protein
MTEAPAAAATVANNKRKHDKDIGDAQKKSNVTDKSSNATDKSNATEKQGWLQVRDAINFFVNDFVTACVRKGGAFKKETWHAVFAFGTVVRIEFPDKKAAANWTFNPKDFDSEFPKYRIVKSQIKRTYATNKAEYDRVMRDQTSFADVIRTAYKILMEAGYPLPGGEGADTVTLPMAIRGDGQKTAEDDKREHKEQQEEEEDDEEEEEEEDDKGEEDEDPDGPYRYLWGVVFPMTGGMDIISMAMTRKEDRCGVQEADIFGRESRRLDYMYPRLVAVINRDLAVSYFE